ncbi:MAG: hypothetical protein VB878_07550 [Pirellulaceae bacterium]
MLEAVLNVFQFELRRSLTRQRIVLWALLAVFPSLLLSLMLFDESAGLSDELIIGVLYVLVPQLTCMLSLLLWMTPAIQSELETSAWPYLAVRPRGRRAVVIGKYFNAVLWTIITMGVSLSLAIMVAQPLHLTKTFAVLFAIGTLSAFGYGTLYALIAVIIPQRAMIMSLAYTLVIEYVIGFVPAIINHVTFSFRLRVLFVDWMGWSNMPQGAAAIMSSDHHAIVHLFMMLVLMAIFAGSTMFILNKKEFVASDDG